MSTIADRLRAGRREIELSPCHCGALAQDAERCSRCVALAEFPDVEAMDECVLFCQEVRDLPDAVKVALIKLEEKP